MQAAVVYAAFVLVFCEHDRARRRARRGVVRAADAYLRHVAEGVVREVVALPRERARADAAFARQCAEISVCVAVMLRGKAGHARD